MEVVKKVEIFIGMSWPFLVVDSDELQGGDQAYFYNHIQLLCYSLKLRWDVAPFRPSEIRECTNAK